MVEELGKQRETEFESEPESLVQFIALPNTVNAGINNLKSLTPSVRMRRRCYTGLLGPTTNHKTKPGETTSKQQV